jgi:hypothetical protein
MPSAAWALEGRLRGKRGELDSEAFFWNGAPAPGDVAQLVERLVRNEEARGSNPLISTRF